MFVCVFLLFSSFANFMLVIVLIVVVFVIAGRRSLLSLLVNVAVCRSSTLREIFDPEEGHYKLQTALLEGRLRRRDVKELIVKVQ